MLSVAIILAIALAIFLGYKTKINTGLFCIVFAYIIGCFVMGLKPKQVIGYWPTSTMFVILSVSLFYNFGKNVMSSFIDVPNIPGSSAVCTSRSGNHSLCYGCNLLYCTGISRTDHSGDLR